MGVPTANVVVLALYLRTPVLRQVQEGLLGNAHSPRRDVGAGLLCLCIGVRLLLHLLSHSPTRTHRKWCGRYFRIGLLVFWSFDICDVFLHLSRAHRYIANVRPLPTPYKIFLFAMVPLSWFLFRMVFFPWKVLTTTFAHSITYVGWMNVDSWGIFNSLLGILTALQVPQNEKARKRPDARTHALTHGHAHSCCAHCRSGSWYLGAGILVLAHREGGVGLCGARRRPRRPPRSISPLQRSESKVTHSAKGQERECAMKQSTNQHNEIRANARADTRRERTQPTAPEGVRSAEDGGRARASLRACS